jgi:EAL domain-containing protein (putative c-di-GMP-specific phosphodiesterase class I)
MCNEYERNIAWDEFQAADLRALCEAECDYGQGSLFSIPLPREQFALLLRRKSVEP